jgi:hypothetical protein
MLGLAPSISCKRFSGLRFASAENDDEVVMASRLTLAAALE